MTVTDDRPNHSPPAVNAPIAEDATNLYAHPNLDRGHGAILERLAVRLAEEKQAAISLIERAIQRLQEHPPEGPPSTADTLITHLTSALAEIEEIEPTARPDAEQFKKIALRLEQLNEFPQTYLLLQEKGLLSKYSTG
ncbi:MAG: hypothetical protein HOM58_19665 [Rhodospirillaceae bacterium]|jgi:hypothetical protein|nr:hypothetical protein [Rhodospirillaceae bacterium]MBT5455895.1 hypothetical protein [Rhodospirillaceae bacterium]